MNEFLYDIKKLGESEFRSISKVGFFLKQLSNNGSEGIQGEDLEELLGLIREVELQMFFVNEVNVAKAEI